MSIQLLLPFYGDSGLLRLAIESVVAQDDPDWRLVVVDNANPDTSHVDYLNELADDRITYVRNDRNLGIGGNFRRCMEFATASHLAMIGADDILLPNYVRRMRELASEYPDASVIQPGVEIIDGAGRRIFPLPDRVKRWYAPRQKRVVLRGEDLAVSLLRGDWTYYPSMLWSGEFLHAHPFRTDLDVVLDLHVKLDVAFDGGSMVVDSVPVFRYRRHASQISSVRAVDGNRFEEERALYAGAAARASALGWRRALRAARSHSSSRLNALTRVPGALGAGDLRGLGLMLRHAFGGTGGSTGSAAA